MDRAAPLLTVSASEGKTISFCLVFCSLLLEYFPIFEHLFFTLPYIPSLFYFYPFLTLLSFLLSSLLLSTLQTHNTENSKQIFPEKELRGLSPSFQIHVSVSDLHMLRICLPILLLQCCRKMCGPILGIYKSPTVTLMWKFGLRPRNSFLGIHKWDFRCSASFWCFHSTLSFWHRVRG